jgi:NAD+ synthase (glutamine-hydrolysing)
MHGFYRVAAAVPAVKVADPEANVNALLELIEQAAAAGAALIVTPELSLTGYTCADLFHQTRLHQATAAALTRLLAATAKVPAVIVVGAPVEHRQRRYNAALVLHGGRLLGVVPKSYLPNYREYYEKRWFQPGLGVTGETLTIAGGEVPFGTDLLFAAGREFVLGVELCEDLWHVIPPSSWQSLAGATVLANLSASVALVAKHEYRRQLVANQSGRCVAAYVYAGAGVHESTTDVVFGGHALIAENGLLLAENDGYQRTGQVVLAEVDLARMVATRQTETSLADHPAPRFRTVPLPALPEAAELRRVIEPQPFVPANPAVREARCREIFQLQSAGLAKRLEHARAQTAVIGVSGGLDSTLALLVAVAAWRALGRGPDQVLAVTMPGFGTSDRTYRNAVALCRLLGTAFRDIDITAACRQHFADLGHDPAVHDVTYENVQARERTQVLMDLANKTGGLVVGTGDLSEIALGWSTYNGDHMSMYAVNCGVPKTLIRYVIGWVAEQGEAPVRELLHDILATPITPELLPTAANGEIAQRTEEVIGPYELHDFFLYHFAKYGAPPDKLLWLAGHAFAGRYDEPTLRRWLQLFLRRFFTHQFKRSCIPDGPKVGTIALSPRGDWRMPSDAVARAWLDAVP